MSDPRYRIAPGRALKHGPMFYDAGADVPADLDAADVKLFLADGTIIPIQAAQAPATKPRKAERTQGLDPVPVP